MTKTKETKTTVASELARLQRNRELHAMHSSYNRMANQFDRWLAEDEEDFEAPLEE